MGEAGPPLVTGADKGDGYEVDEFGVAPDLTDQEGVAAAAELLADRVGHLDAMVDNAGTTGDWPQLPRAVHRDLVRIVVEMDVTGVIRVTNARLSRLRRVLAADRQPAPQSP